MSVFVLPLNTSSSPSAKADSYMPVQTAAEYSGYNQQHIRRLLVSGAIEGVKVGQVWMVKVSSLNEYLGSIRKTSDRRFGPRVYQEYIESKES